MIRYMQAEICRYIYDELWDNTVLDSTQFKIIRWADWERFKKSNA